MTALAILLVALAAGCAVGTRPAVDRVRRALAGAESSPDHEPASNNSDEPVSGSALSGRRSRALSSALAGVAVALFVPAPAMVVAVPVVAGGCWWLLGRAEPASRARERRRLDLDVPLAAELLAAAITAGCSVGDAVAVVGRALGGPAGRALRRSAAAAAVGSHPAAVWAPLRAESALIPLARALDAAVSRGTSPVPALQRIAEDARLDARWTAQGRARSLGARAAAPLGLCFLPAFVLLAVVPLVATTASDLF